MPGIGGKATCSPNGSFVSSLESLINLINLVLTSFRCCAIELNVDLNLLPCVRELRTSIIFSVFSDFQRFSKFMNDVMAYSTTVTYLRS